MMVRNRVRERGLITLLVNVPMFWARFLTETTMEPKSCTPAAKTVPSTTHSKAGTHPQKTAMAGPTIGAAPATDVKW